MTDTVNQDCRILLDVLMAQGLRDAVLSPGSRNTPLLIAASARPEIRSYVVTDERTAGFIALGMAVASRRPVLLCCTSGTAMYNYAPAIAEAMYQKIPLIVLTADRPARWIDQDDSQTLRQPDALEKIVKRSFNIPTAGGNDTPTAGSLFGSEREWFVNRTANEAWLAATLGQPGPVHINMQLELAPETGAPVVTRKERIVRVVRGNAGLDPETLKQWAAHMAGKRILVTAGFMQPDHKLSIALGEFMKLPNVAVCAEPLSNLRIDPVHRQIDSLLHPRKENPELCREIKKTLRPDIVISIGGALVSRMLKDFLREYQPSEHYTLSDTDWGVDCFQSLTTHFDVSPTRFFSGIASITHWIENNRGDSMPECRYADLWHEMRMKHSIPADKFLPENNWSELAAFSKIFKALPANYNLFLSNGTAVRYGGICLDRMPHAVYGNRGVSGIEGTTATAVGIAMRYSGPTLLVTGDMSFGYNPQILGNELVPENFKIIVVNNAGGGIFRFIATTRHLEQREEYFCADRPQPLEGLCAVYGWQYCMADSPKSLEKALPAFFESPGRSMLEIRVNPAESAATLLSYLS